MAKVMIEVDEDSPEAAIHGTRKGEKWERDGEVMHDMEWGFVQRHNDGYGMYTNQVGISRSGWRRVEETLLCPRCGSVVRIEYIYDGVWKIEACQDCGLHDETDYDTRAEAIAAWKRIGGAR